MFDVAGSGVIGRYIYSRVHHGLYGSKATLSDLRSGADNLHSVSGSVAFVPELVSGSTRRSSACSPPDRVCGTRTRQAHYSRSTRGALTLESAPLCTGRLRAAARKSTTVAGHAAGCGEPHLPTSTEGSRPRAGWQISRCSSDSSLSGMTAHPADRDAAAGGNRPRHRGPPLLTRTACLMRAGTWRECVLVAILLCVFPAQRAAAVNPEKLFMPGELTTAHQKLEEQCSNCHDRSNRGASGNCVSTVTRHRGRRQCTPGFHGRLRGIDSAQCRACHSEHQGP